MNTSLDDPLSMLDPDWIDVLAVSIYTKLFPLKIKTILTIFIPLLCIFLVLEGKTLSINASLMLMNMSHNTAWYMGDALWVTKFNEAIWLSSRGKYSEAKSLLSPLLNDTTIPKKAEIAELYGDLIYHTSESAIDTIRMYERSLAFAPNDRIVSKIAYIKKQAETLSSSWSSDKSAPPLKTTSSGSREREAKKEELKKIATQRSEYLWNNIMSSSDSRSMLERLVESAASGSIEVVQDW